MPQKTKFLLVEMGGYSKKKKKRQERKMFGNEKDIFIILRSPVVCCDSAKLY